MRIGRSSSITSDEAVFEVKGFAGNRPVLKKALKLNTETGDLVLEKCVEKARDLNGSGNGCIVFDLDGKGLYVAESVLCTSSHLDSYYVEVDENNNISIINENDDNEFAGVKKRIFPVDYEVYSQNRKKELEALKEARRLMNEIAEERKTYLEEEVDGLKAVPEFRNFDIKDLVKIIKNAGNIDEFMMNYIVPERYVTSPVFATGRTAEEAISAAKEKIEEREKEREKAVQETAGLPSLSGTERQIAWATTIRAKVAKSNPALPALKKATTAKYWIENYRDLK